MTTLLRTVDNRLRITRLGIIRLTASVIAALALHASGAETAAAQSRPETTRMSCAAARALVTRQGAIVLGTGSSLYDRNAPPLYDRYVANKSFCQAGQGTILESVPTADTQSCRVSKCLDESRFGGNNR